MLERLKQNAAPNVMADAADLHALQERLGSAEAATAVSAEELAPCLAGIHSADDLRRFLARYQAEMIGPRELEIIFQSHDHASRNEARELIALDQSIRFEEAAAALAAASRQVGRNQLRRLRPLKDMRGIQRYADAVQQGRATGWHTVVFGLVLAAYGIPLRQGLHHYCRQTVLGFVEAGVARLRLAPAEAAALAEETLQTAPGVVEQFLQARPAPGLRCV